MNKTFLAVLMLIQTCSVFATTVRFETTVGDIDIELYDEQTPVTVQNFLNYVNDGDYDDTVIHRSDPGFVIQGGGYRYSGSSTFQNIATDPPIVNESGLSNIEATISMARLPAANSATSQWFINLTDNSAVLDEDSDDPGFAVFGKIVRGYEVVQLIESFFRIDFSTSNIGLAASAFPIYGFFSGTAVTLDNAVKINRAYVLQEEFQINAGISGAWVNPETFGQGFYFEVLPGVDTLIMAWFTFDSQAPDAGVPSTVGDASNRWLTASGTYQDNQFTGNLLKTSGGLFDDPTAASNVVVGEVMIDFNDCSTAVMSYSLNDSDLTNTINIQRISGVNVNFCEQLAIEAK